MGSVLILSKTGDGYPLALKLAEEGHVVRIYIEDEGAKNTGIQSKNPKTVPFWKPYIESSDLILADMVGFGSEMDKLAKAGRVILGGCRLADKLELDREYAMKVVGSLTQVKIPLFEKYTSVEEGVKDLQNRFKGKRMVLKPLGNKATQLTLVSTHDKENQNLISFLSTTKESVTPFLLQEYIEGIEVSTEGWFNGEEFILPFNHTVEYKRLMEGNKGPNTGCMGNVVWFTETDKIVEEALLPLQDFLMEAGYVGPIDMNTIINEEGIYFLEFTTRFGYEALQALGEGLRMPFFEFLYGLSLRTLTRAKVNNKFNIAVRLSMPPYPFGDEKSLKALEGYEALKIPVEAKKHIWLADTLDGKVMAGVDGVIGCVTAYGDTVNECRRRVYRTISNIVQSQDVQYRTDIGYDVDGKIERLSEWNYLKTKEEIKV